MGLCWIGIIGGFGRGGLAGRLWGGGFFGSSGRGVRGLDLPNDVAGGGGGVVDAHEDGFLGRAAGVGDDPGHDEGIAAEQESEEVVSCEQSALMGGGVAGGVEHGGAGDDGEGDGDEDGGFEFEFRGGVGSGEDDDELQGAEGDIQEAGGVGGEAETAEDQGAESVGHGGADVQQHREANEEVGFGLEDDFEDMRPFEFATTGAGLVGAEALDGFGFVLFAEKACGRDVVVEFPVDERCSDDSHEADEEEDDLPRR